MPCALTLDSEACPDRSFPISLVTKLPTQKQICEGCRSNLYLVAALDSEIYSKWQFRRNCLFHNFGAYAERWSLHAAVPIWPDMAEAGDRLHVVSVPMH